MTKKVRKPSKQCATCVHDERSRIEYLVAAGVSQRSVAERFGLSHWAVLRHWQNHVSPALKSDLVVKALKPRIELAELVEREGTGPLENLSNVRAKLHMTYDAASEANDRNGGHKADGDD
jgi:hypothetical protein